jgi:hypothetical protein
MLFYSNLVLFYSNLIASHLTSSLLTSSHLIYLSHLILSIYLILSHLIWSYLTLSDLICFYLMLYHAISCYLMLSHLIYLILFFLFYLVWFIHLIHLIYLICLIHLIHLILSDLNVDLNLNLIYQASNQSTCLYTYLPIYMHFCIMNYDHHCRGILQFFSFHKGHLLWGWSSIWMKPWCGVMGVLKSRIFQIRMGEILRKTMILGDKTYEKPMIWRG